MSNNAALKNSVVYFLISRDTMGGLRPSPQKIICKNSMPQAKLFGCNNIRSGSGNWPVGSVYSVYGVGFGIQSMASYLVLH